MSRNRHLHTTHSAKRSAQERLLFSYINILYEYYYIYRIANGNGREVKLRNGMMRMSTRAREGKNIANREREREEEREEERDTIAIILFF